MSVNLNSRTVAAFLVYDINFTYAIANVGLRFSLVFDTNISGHEHTSGRPTLATVEPRTCNTGYDGQQCVLTIKTHESIAGSIRIVATVTNGPDAGKSFAATNKILSGFLQGADLSELEPTSHWKPVGRTTRHTNNHFGQAGFLYNVGILAELYDAQFPELDVLCVNDMALIKGGMFDIDGTWRPPHQEHEQGLNADIRARPGTSPNDTVACQGMPRDAVVRSWFTNTLLVVFGHSVHLLEFVSTDSEHYHIRDRIACNAPGGTACTPRR